MDGLRSSYVAKELAAHVMSGIGIAGTSELPAVEGSIGFGKTGAECPMSSIDVYSSIIIKFVPQLLGFKSGAFPLNHTSCTEM